MKSLRIIPIKGGFVLVEDCVPAAIAITDLKAIVEDKYSHQLTDVISKWRSEHLERNPPPETP